MRVRRVLFAAPLLLLACDAPAVSLACRPMASGTDLTGRASPYDSALVSIGTHQAQVCYSRPSTKGRPIFGALIPFDSLWRTGANEPTILHLPFDAEIAGLQVPAGSYSLYTVPGATQWTVVLNRSTSQWGLTRDEPNGSGGMNRSSYTEAVRAEELGRAPIPIDSIEHVEQFTIRTEAGTGNTATLLLEWERTRARIPIRALGDSAS